MKTLKIIGYCLFVAFVLLLFTWLFCLEFDPRISRAIYDPMRRRPGLFP